MCSNTSQWLCLLLESHQDLTAPGSSPMPPGLTCEADLLTLFHVGASNQPCGIQTSQPGPGRVTQHYRCTSRPPTEAPYCQCQQTQFRRLRRSFSLLGFWGFSSLSLSDMPSLAAGLEHPGPRLRVLISIFSSQPSCLFVLVCAAKRVTDHGSV